VHRIDTETREEDLHGSGKDGFTAGDPGAAIAPTDLSADWCNAVQEELAHVVEDAGLTLNKGDHHQLAAAVGVIVRQGYRFKQRLIYTLADMPAEYEHGADVRAVDVQVVGAGGAGGGAEGGSGGACGVGGAGAGGTLASGLRLPPWQRPKP
jgi:hypothetical protein